MNRMVILFLVSKNCIANLIAVELNTNSKKLTMLTSKSFPSGGKNFPAAQMLPPEGINLDFLIAKRHFPIIYSNVTRKLGDTA